MSEPAISINFSAGMVGSSTCAKGNGLVYDTAAQGWRVATAANRTTANARTQAIAMTAYGGALVGVVQYQMSGLLAQEISGLPALTPSATTKLVRMSTTGALERVDSYTTGDDLVGVAYWDGRVQLMIGFPLDMIIALAVAAAPTSSSPTFVPTDSFGKVDLHYVSGGAGGRTVGSCFTMMASGESCYGIRAIIANDAPVTVRAKLWDVAAGVVVVGGSADLAASTAAGGQVVEVAFAAPLSLDHTKLYFASVWETASNKYTASYGGVPFTMGASFAGYYTKFPVPPFFTGEDELMICALNCYGNGDTVPNQRDTSGNTDAYLVEPITSPIT